MLNFAVMLLDNSYCSSVSGVIDVFQIANAHCRASPAFAEEPFRWSLLSYKGGEQVKVMGGITMQSDASLESADEFDMLYLPAGSYPDTARFNLWLEQQDPLYATLQNLAANGKKVAGSCTSTFLLAEAGLLDDKLATTTWWLEKQFRNRFPTVNLDANLALTEDQGVFCTGALSAYHQLGLRLVEEYASTEISMLCAKSMLINQDNISQTPFYDLNIAVGNEDPVIVRAQYWLRNHMSRDVNFALLADELKISQRTLIRRFSQATGTTPLKFLQNLRLESAKTLLVNGQLPVADIMEQVGYSDPSAFNRLFKGRVGLTPSAYRQRFATNKIS